MRLPRVIPLEVLYATAAAVLTAALLRYGWSPFDDGVYAWIARRLIDGATAHGEVRFSHPGYAHYLNAWLLQQFDSSLLALRYPLPLLAALIVASIAYLARPAGRLTQFVCALAATCLGVVQFISPSASWYATALAAAAFAALVAAEKRQGSARTMLLVATGLLLGLCGGFRQFNGAMLGAGLVLAHVLIRPSLSAAHSRLRQILSLAAVLAAVAILAIAGIGSNTPSSRLLLMPALLCAFHAVHRWVQDPAIRDPAWLLPVALGVLAGFAPVLVPPLVHGVMDGFVLDVFGTGSRFLHYSANVGTSFANLLADAAEAARIGTARSTAIALYLVLVVATPVCLTFLLVRKRSLTPGNAPLAVLAATWIPGSIVFEDLLYVFFWLPAASAALLMLTRERKTLRWIALGSVAFMSLVALAFHAGRIPGSTASETLRGRYDRLPCALPRCELVANRTVVLRIRQQRRDILRSVAPTRALMVLPSGADLYPLLPHAAPWSTPFVVPGFSERREYQQLLSEFLARPGAALVIPRDLPRGVQSDPELEAVRGSLCRETGAPSLEVYRACTHPATVGMELAR